MKHVAIIGAGGINSWVVKNLNDLLQVFDKRETMYIKIFDNDIVEEKNLLRQNQNFEVTDLMQSKAEALSKRYNFVFENIFITKENIEILKPFDDIILGVDNNKVRKLIYEYALENNKYVLDLRAQGTQIAFFLPHNRPMEYWNTKLFSNKELMERKGSCQLQNDITNDNIQNGNKIIATIGVYGIYLKHLRGEEVSTHEWQWLY